MSHTHTHTHTSARVHTHTHTHTNTEKLFESNRTTLHPGTAAKAHLLTPEGSAKVYCRVSSPVAKVMNSALS